MSLINKECLLEEVENGIKSGNFIDGYEQYPHINDMDDIVEAIKHAEKIPAIPIEVLQEMRTEISKMSDSYVEGTTVTFTTWKGMQERIINLINTKIKEYTE